jgi:hypothetical protein
MVTARNRWRWRAASSGIPRRRRRHPRRRFAETLIEAFAAFDAPILVYSVYEQTRLKDLAGEYPDLSSALTALIALLVDLLPIVGGAVYFPEFRFSNLIKSVAPALCPGFGYDGLEGVAAGGAASAAFLQLASGYLTIPEEVDHLRSALLALAWTRSSASPRAAMESAHLSGRLTPGSVS